MTRFRQQWNRIKNAHTHSAQKKETTVKLFKWCWQIIIARLCIKYLLGLMRARHHLNRLWHHRTRISLMRVIFIYFDNGLRGVKKNLCFFFFILHHWQFLWFIECAQHCILQKNSLQNMCVFGTITVQTVGEISIEYYLPWAGFWLTK